MESKRHVSNVSASVLAVSDLLYKIVLTRSILKKISDVVTLGTFVIGTSYLLIGGGRLFFFSQKERY